MSSILTNNGAMVALQTLKTINSDLAKTQSLISTGKNVASAKDNAAVWAISKVMEADVKGFKGISDSLALGEATVAVGRQAAETITGLLTDIKGKIVAAQESNVDRDKIQTDIDALRSQVASVVSAAQFNGLNLVDGSQTTVDVLSSLDRGSSGAVSVSSISVTAQNLSTGDYTANDVFTTGGNATVSADGDTFVMSLDAAGGTDTISIQDGATAWAAGDAVSITVAGKTATYTVSNSDLYNAGASTVADLVAVGLKNALDGLGIKGLQVEYDSANPGELTLTNQTGTDIDVNGDGDTTDDVDILTANNPEIDFSVTGQFKNAGSGDLGTLASIDVTTATGAETALGNIESLIQTAIDAASSFGSVEGRIETQADFISALTDSLKSGIGSMVDADMEEASARLQALQVQQQLGIQSLSIANQAPQSILSLFR